MSWPYLHTVVNHFPIVLAVIGALAVLVAAMFERRAIWVYALSTLTLAGLTIYPAWLTGDKAATAVRRAWYIERGAVHTHSSAAGITLWVVGVTGLLALISLITLARTREATSPAKGLRVLVGLGALVSICAVSYTGYLGGQIVIDSPILASPASHGITVPVPAANPTLTPTTTATPTTTTQPSLPPAAAPASAIPTQPVAPPPSSPVPQPRHP